MIYYPVARSRKALTSKELATMQELDKILQQDNPESSLATMFATNFSDVYATVHTNLSEKDANSLMTLMEYNVLNKANWEKVRTAICKKITTMSSAVPAAQSPVLLAIPIGQGTLSQEAIIRELRDGARREFVSAIDMIKSSKKSVSTELDRFMRKWDELIKRVTERLETSTSLTEFDEVN